MQIPAWGRAQINMAMKNTPDRQRSAEFEVEPNKQQVPDMVGAGRRNHGPGGAI